MTSSFVLYGAYGYTGNLIAEEAKRRGLNVVLAGRDREKLSAQAARLRLDYRLFDLDDLRLVVENIRDVEAVLHCAGPFAQTAAPMVAACLKAGVHYLDITGELEVFQAVAAQDEAARRVGVMLLPGAGFDIVPTDCLAAHLKRTLPDATHLQLAFQGLSVMSRGTATTMLAGLASGEGGKVREDGSLRSVPVAHKTLQIPFGNGTHTGATVPWGDVFTAQYSTGIPNTEVYMAMNPGMVLGARVGRAFSGLFGLNPVHAYLQRKIDERPPGPDARVRQEGKSYLWGRVTNASGKAEARLTAPEAYQLTMLSSLRALERVLAGDAPPGYQTPSTAFGADFVLELPGVTPFEDLNEG